MGGVEPILLLIGGWWWVAPAAIGVGAATYSGLTTKSRRARRLDLDAARHDEGVAYRRLLAERARVGTARAEAAVVRSRSRAPIWDAVMPTTPETFAARQRLAEAKRSERAAQLELQASRARVRAANVQYHSLAARRDPLPIEKLWAEHDAINARWVAYETDPALAIDFPQMADARHPATLAFLRAQREALHRRPLLRDRIEPARYAEYRAAVTALEAALAEAERQAGARAASDSVPPNPWDAVWQGVWQATGWRPTAPTGR